MRSCNQFYCVHQVGSELGQGSQELEVTQLLMSMVKVSGFFCIVGLRFQRGKVRPGKGKWITSEKTTDTFKGD